MKSTEITFGFECSGNRRPLQGLCSNGHWTGVPLRTVLDQAGVKSEAKEFVFFGADRGDEEVEFRTQKFTVNQQFGRSLPREKALSAEPILAYSMNGEPLTKHQGFPLRLIVPGWYGVGNVKWLSEIHAQEDQYLGKYQARWYRTLRGEMINGEMKWTEAAVTSMQLKSFIARVSRAGDRFNVRGVILNDGTPIKSVEVKVDDGPWQAGDDRQGHERQVLLEAVQLHLDRGHAGRAHARLARHRRQRAWCSRRRRIWRTRRPSSRTTRSTRGK